MRAAKEPRGGSRPDLLAGAIFIGVGALGLWAGRDLPMGTAASMGPGYLPTVVSSLVLVIGAVVAVMGFLRAREPLPTIRLRPVLIVLLAIVGFAVAARFLGFVSASVLLVGLGSLADRDSKPIEIVVSMVALTIFGALVFIVGLGVQMKMWPF